MSRWAELKEAFWAAADADPSEHAGHVAALASVDPELAGRLEALLAADARGESLQQIFEAESDPAERPLRIGGYAVTGVLGVGGMGEVYRARDTRLNRDVAIKVVPAAFTHDSERLGRFEREAQVLASLNHPHIAHVYGLDESGSAPALVMELVEGPTLAQVIASYPEAPLTVARVFEIARQIADGLHAAHEEGIVHRDLKPGNVALTKKGDVKILDFGVAKTLERATPDAPHASVDADVGVVLGTPPYMSPEQARGLTVDERTDIWAFGCLLYELLTARQPFAGVTASDSLAAVLERNPDMAILPPETPSAVRSLLHQCLEKDPSRRLRDIADARRTIDDALTRAPATETRTGGGRAVRTRMETRAREPRLAGRLVRIAVLALGLTGIGYGAIAWWRASRETEPTRAVPLTSLTGAVRAPSFSTDGAFVAFTWSGDKQDNPDVYVHHIGVGSPRRVTTHPGNDYGPSWSPDGRTIAFLRRDPGGLTSEVRLVAPSGGLDRKLADVLQRFPYLHPASLTWCPDSTCVVVTDSPGDEQWDALFAVSLDTGEKRQLTRPERAVDVDPAVSPDGRSLVFFRRDPTSLSGAFYRLPLGERMAPGEPVRLTGAVRGGKPAWMPDGREILFTSRRALWRLDALQGGTPARVPSVEDCYDVAVSRAADGRQRLVYARGVVDTNVWRIDIAVSRAAASSPPVPAIASTRTDSTADLSPDGRRLAFVSDRSGDAQIWIANTDGTNPVQLTDEVFVAGFSFPRWSPGGDVIVFDNAIDGPRSLFVVPAGGGRPRRVSPDLPHSALPRFSPDGRWIYFAMTDKGGPRIWKMPSEGGAAVQVTPNPGSVSVESPDGRYLYYTETTARPSALWRLPLAGGLPVKLLDGVVVGAFALVDAGIYYLDRPSLARGAFVFDRPNTETRLRYFDFATRQSTTVVGNLGAVAFGLTASPDGGTVFLSRLDSVFDELMLMDDFK